MRIGIAHTHARIVSEARQEWRHTDTASLSDGRQLRTEDLGGYGSGAKTWPVPVDSATGLTTSAVTGLNAGAIGATAIMLQNENAHAAGVMPFSLPAQPSHFPCIGMSAVIAAAVISAWTAWTRIVNAVARATERTNTNNRRAVSRHMIVHVSSSQHPVPGQNPDCSLHCRAELASSITFSSTGAHGVSD